MRLKMSERQLESSPDGHFIVKQCLGDGGFQVKTAITGAETPLFCSRRIVKSIGFRSAKIRFAE
jgi:hypothetical protein